VTQEEIAKAKAETELAILVALNALQRKTGKRVGYVSTDTGRSFYPMSGERAQPTTGKPAPALTPKPLLGVQIALEDVRA